MREVLRLARRLLAVVVSVVALAGLVRLVAPATGGSSGEPPGVRHQLAFLRSALDGGAGDEAQGLFPEGYFFLHALYGLTWVDVGLREPSQRAVAAREAGWALDRLDSEAGRAPFSPSLVPSYGVFYRGWTTWLRGGLLKLQRAGLAADPAQERRFVEDAAALGAAFDASPSPYLEAYPGQAWPVDSTVAVAALRLHDSLFPARFGATVQRWLAAVRERLDPRTGLLPHRVDPATGAPIEVARGSSQSIIQRFLVDVDEAFAADQYARFRARYVVWPLRLGPAVREYTKGMDGPADVDSGPLPLGVSLSATAVTIGAAQVHGDAALAEALANYGEVAGWPAETPWTKRYALGLLPIGDAFLAWSKAAQPWVARPPATAPWTVPTWWRLPLGALFVLVGGVPWLPLAVRRLRRSGAPWLRPVVRRLRR